LAETEAQRLSELRSLVARDPAVPGFATLAELHRRARRFAEAERVLHAGLGRRPDDLAARALLALVLWDQGRDADARAELSRVASALVPEAAASAASGAVSEAELDHAFAEAETDAEQLIDPNRVAAEAILQADAGAAEGLREDSAEPAYAAGQAFVTETMARLLDRQGDARGAARIRAALTAEESAPSEQRRAREKRRARSLAVLERWLANLRRDWA
jgi:hypothetical protein